MSSFGELMEEAARMTSRLARDAADRAAGLVLDADGAPALDDDAANVRVGPQLQVAALQRRLEIGVGG